MMRQIPRQSAKEEDWTKDVGSNFDAEMWTEEAFEGRLKETFGEEIYSAMEKNEDFKKQMVDKLQEHIDKHNKLWEEYMPTNKLRQMWAQLMKQESTGDKRSLYDQMMHEIGKNDDEFKDLLMKVEAKLAEG